MSAPRYRIHPKLLSLLHERGETVASIARQAGTGRAHANQVMANKPGRGYITRCKLAQFLKPEELQILGWDALGQRLMRVFPVKRSNPLSPSCPVLKPSTQT
jgi:hypothetical protein